MQCEKSIRGTTVRVCGEGAKMIVRAYTGLPVDMPKSRKVRSQGLFTISHAIKPAL